MQDVPSFVETKVVEKVKGELGPAYIVSVGDSIFGSGTDRIRIRS